MLIIPIWGRGRFTEKEAFSGRRFNILVLNNKITESDKRAKIRFSVDLKSSSVADGEMVRILVNRRHIDFNSWRHRNEPIRRQSKIKDASCVKKGTKTEILIYIFIFVKSREKYSVNGYLKSKIVMKQLFSQKSFHQYTNRCDTKCMFKSDLTLGKNTRYHLTIQI